MKKHMSNNEKHWMLYDKYRVAEAETKRKDDEEITRVARHILGMNNTGEDRQREG